MSDYTCPDCRGGFPASAADDGACPWCGAALDGERDDGPTTPSAPPAFPPDGRRVVSPMLPTTATRDPHEPTIINDDGTSFNPAELLDPDRPAKVGGVGGGER